MKKEKKLYLIVTLAFIFFIISFEKIQQGYLENEKANYQSQLRIYSDKIAKDLEYHITNIVYSMEILKEIYPEGIMNRSDRFIDIIEEKVSSHFYLHAINYINTDGVIAWVYPEKRNKEALNQKVIERKDVNKHLINSKKFKKGQMTGVIETYQGVKGMAIYCPLYHKGEFHGWTNILFHYDKLIEGIIKRSNIDNFVVELSFENGFKDQFSKTTSGSAEDISNWLSFESKVQILNQTIKLNTYLPPQTQTTLFKVIIWLARISLVFLLILGIILIRHLTFLERQNNQLEQGKILVNTLSHDLSTPVTSLGLLLDQIKDKIEDKQYKRFKQIVSHLNNILTKGREIQTSDIHDGHLKKQKVDLKKTLEETLNLYQDRLKEKNIHIKTDVNDYHVWADGDILKQNILSNIIDNAIKFSLENSQIHCFTTEQDGFVTLSIKDNGIGITEEKLQKLYKNKKLFSGFGADGEKGSGLGWIQIHYFCSKLDIDANVESKKCGSSENKETIVSLKFKKANA